MKNILAPWVRWFPVILFAALPQSSNLSAADPEALDSAPVFTWAEMPRPTLDLAFADADRNDLTLADFRGKWVLLNVWATFCYPCLREMPSLDRLQTVLGDDSFEIIALNEDFGDTAKKIDISASYYAETELENLKIYVDYNDRDKKSYIRLRIRWMPTTILIDPEGREVGRHEGAVDWASGESVEVLRAAFAEWSPNGAVSGLPSQTEGQSASQ